MNEFKIGDVWYLKGINFDAGGETEYKVIRTDKPNWFQKLWNIDKYKIVLERSDGGVLEVEKYGYKKPKRLFLKYNETPASFNAANDRLAFSRTSRHSSRSSFEFEFREHIRDIEATYRRIYSAYVNNEDIEIYKDGFIQSRACKFKDSSMNFHTTIKFDIKPNNEVS